MKRLFAVCATSLVAGGVTFAQIGRGGSEWVTAFADAQRTSWIRSDPKISLEAMSKPGFELQWKTKLETQPPGRVALSQGVTANGVTLFVPMSIVVGSNNNLYGLDNDTGYVVWQRRFDVPAAATPAGCAGGSTPAATRIVNVTPPPLTAPVAGAGGGGGRAGAGYRSLLGEPGEGVPVEARAGGAAGAPPVGNPAGARGAVPQGAPAPGADAGRGVAPAGARAGGGGAGRGAQGAGIPGAPAAGGGGGLGRGGSRVVYTVSSDGMLRVVGLPSGKDIQKPAPFIPAPARWSDAIAVNTTLYAATSGTCGGAPNGVWAIDLAAENKPVVSWRTNGGAVVGAVAFTTDGSTLLVAVGPGQATGDGKANAIVALDPKTLQMKDWYTQPTAEFVTGPMVFRHNNTDVVAAGTKDGRIVLLDASSLGGTNHTTPLHASRALGGTFSAEALATWQQVTAVPGAAPAAPAPPAGAPVPPGAAPDAGVILGARWILASVNGRPAGAQATNGALTTGGVIALKLVGTGSALALEPAWTSHNLSMPATPIIVNGVVFALGTGRSAGTGAGTPAVLHAYDGATGKALWNSQRIITSAAAPGSFWSGFGQTYVGTGDGTIYSFGFRDERR
ncbi:MAG: hypothetical protein ABI051_16805 [Vicinamibacterales bacterium]